MPFSRDVATARTRRPNDHGFTLIELLVVIIILGILSAVVVFAVRGAGDKGEANALATDNRTIRTAQETFCATYDRYAVDMDELANGPRNASGGRDGKGFLSEPSTYHSVVGTDGGGPCNGWSYEISGTPLPGVDLCLPGTWCEAAAPNIFGPQMIQLPNGDVLRSGSTEDGLEPDTTVVPGRTSTTGTRTMLYDPAAGPKGTWTEGPIARTLTSGGWSVGVLIEGTIAQCGGNCGKVLVRFHGGGGLWKLYTPAAGPDGTGAWTATIDPSTHSAFNYGPVKAIQLRDDPTVVGEECYPNCGKVLILGKAGSRTPPMGELYNPVDNTFENLGAYGDSGYANVLDPVQLRDGRVLVHHMLFGAGDTAVQLFDPETLLFTLGAEPLGAYRDDIKAVLPDGGVLFSHMGVYSEIYRPGPRGGFDPLGGTWEIIPSCSAPTSGGAPPPHPLSSPNCFIIASLPDGRVLVNRRYGFETRGGRDEGGNSQEVFFFDPNQPDRTKAWSLTGPMVSPDGLGMYSAVLLKGTPAQCSINCGKVLSVGAYDGKYAELYRPPFTLPGP